MMCRKIGGGLIIALSLSVAFTLLSGNLLHALIPHEHGPNGSETISWGTLHAALQHGDKKVPLVPFIPVGVAILAPLLWYTPLQKRTVFIDALHEYLMRGIAPYRKFG